jgi:hypothetical protein
MDASGSTTNDVTIRLSGDEALVLFDALAGWESSGELARLTASDRAAQRVFSDLVASFEPLVDVVFSSDFAKHLQRAQAAVLRAP